MNAEARIEALVGAFVIGCAVWFVGAAYRSSDNVGAGYILTAEFSRVDGLSTGADVRLAGVKIGNVRSLHLDPTRYRAQAELAIDPAYRLPTDSMAKIAVDGLLGGAHINLEPGSADTVLATGEAIENTQSAINITDLIAKAVFGGGTSGTGSTNGGTAGGTAAKP